MVNHSITAQNAPEAIGPYVHATLLTDLTSGCLLLTSGQLGIDPQSGDLAPDVARQTKLALANLWAVLQAGGVKHLSQVAKTTVFLTNMDDFQQVNTIYADFFGDHKPARSCVQVAALPKGAAVEIEAIAFA